MIISDFLSRQKHDDSDQHDIMPFSFNMQCMLQTRYYNISEKEQGKYLFQTRSLAKLVALFYQRYTVEIKE